MLADLGRWVGSIVGFRDRLPYVLDLLAGITRTIDDESRGHRTQAFATWWPGIDRTSQDTIQELRNAELKRLERRTVAEIQTAVNVIAADYPDLRLADGDTLTTKTWSFVGGAFDGQPVLETLRKYREEAEALIDEAEAKLDP